MYRNAAVAGYFYSKDKKELISFIDKNKYVGEKEDTIFALVPHAGYEYSGSTLVKTLSAANFTDTVIILGVNHTGFGEPIALWDKGAWETPFGDLKIDEELAAEIIKCSDGKSDIVAHVREHSIEVITPVLKYLYPSIKIVPITVMGMNMSKIKAFARDLSRFTGKNGKSLIISSDMNHYEDEETTNSKDFLAIEQILKIDGQALYDTVMESSISMCGIYPATAGLMAVSASGASSGTLIEHTTSGSVSGDYKQVVGYAGIIIK